MPGSEQFLSTLIEKLVTASNSQVEELTTVASRTSDQLTALQNMVTALGEVKTATEATMPQAMEVSENVKLSDDTVYSTSSTSYSTKKTYKIYKKGKIKYSFEVKNTGGSTAGMIIAVNGITVKEYDGYDFDRFQSTYSLIEEELLLFEKDTIEIKIRAASSYSLSIKNQNISYDLIAEPEIIES